MLSLLPDKIDIFDYARENVWSDSLVWISRYRDHESEWSGERFFSEGDLIKSRKKLMKATGVDDVFYCPHHPEGLISKYTKICDCRKPNTGLIKQAVKKYDIDTGKSFMVGDRACDILMGQNVGVRTVLVDSGYGRARLECDVEPDYYCRDLREFVFDKLMGGDRMKVLTTTSSFGKADSKPLDVLKEKCDVMLNPYKRKVTAKEFVELTEGMDGVIAGVENITREALEKRPDLKVISRCGVGMDSVDIEACRELGVKVYNTPNAPVDSVAELTVTMMLDLLKKVSAMDAAMKSGNWSKMTGSMLKGKKVGIIGMGRIGSRVAELVSAFGAEIAYADIDDKNNGYSYMTKQDLLKWADIVTVHTSACEEGSFVIGANELSAMRETAYLINTSRGRFIDEEALYDSLKTGLLQGAALDVFSEEPYKGKLMELDNVILTPHISSSAKEARAVMEMEAVYNLFDGLGIEYDKNDNL